MSEDEKLSAATELGDIDVDEVANNEEEDEPATNERRKKPAEKRQKPKKQQNPRKRQKKNIRDYFDMEVDEDDEEEISDEGDEAGGEISKKEQERYFKEMMNRKERNTPKFLKMDDEDVQEYFEGRSDEDQDFEGEQAPLTKQGMLPTLKDPKLFQVGCKRGSEREAVFEIMQRFMKYQGNAHEIRIVSANALDKIKGYIYVEAFNLEDVTSALESNSFTNKQIKRVDLANVPQIFEPDVTRNIDLKIEQFVRIKKGVYEGDLARIYDIDDNKKSIEVQLVPRLALNDEEEQKDENGEDLDETEKRKRNFQEARLRAQKKIRAPARLFDPNERTQGVESTRALATNQKFYTYKGQRFSSGLLYKKYPIASLQIGSVVPTYDEIQTFAKALGENANIEDMYKILLEKTGQDRFNKFKVGDKVIVVSGQYNGLTGAVKKVAPNGVTIVTPQIDEPLEFLPAELAKNFNKGDYVRAIAGKNVGKVGFISTITDNNAVITSEDLKSSFTTFVNDLVLASETTRIQQFENKANEFKKFDLVRLNDTKTFGCVISLDDFNMRIIDNGGRAMTIKFSDVDFAVDTRRYIAKNDFGQEFHINDTVKILDGFYKGTIGSIKHIYKGHLFLFNLELQKTSGLFVEKVNNCYLVSSKIDNKDRKPDKLLGVLCQIVKGPWKGYQGLVREVTDRLVTIEISSRCMKKTMDRNLVKPLSEINDEEHRYNSNAFDPKTPMPDSRLGLNSPHIGNSPGFHMGAGFETPAYESSYR